MNRPSMSYGSRARRIKLYRIAYLGNGIPSLVSPKAHAKVLPTMHLPSFGISASTPAKPNDRLCTHASFPNRARRGQNTLVMNLTSVQLTATYIYWHQEMHIQIGCRWWRTPAGTDSSRHYPALPNSTRVNVRLDEAYGIFLDNNSLASPWESYRGRGSTWI